jgi:hypothetical protein
LPAVARFIIRFQVMRIAVVLGVSVLAACASEKLATAPPARVDLSGHWALNEADSDDPLRLMQSQLAAATANASAGGPGPTGGSGGSGGRGGGRGGRNNGFGAGAPMGPVMPPVAVLDEALHWPGKDLGTQQSGGDLTFTSDGRNRVCRPGAAKPPHHPSPKASDESEGRPDAPVRRGNVRPLVCGWDEGTLVVKPSDPEDDRPPFEQRFSLSDDGQRLIEVVSFKGGRSSGFTASRVWDRVIPGAAPAPSPGAAPNPPPVAPGSQQ